MGKKLAAFVCAVTMVFGAAGYLPNSVFETLGGLSASAYYDYDILDNGTVAIVRYTDDYESITLPDFIVDIDKPWSVTAIGDRAFYGKSTIKEVVFSTKIETIGDEAFYNCCNLEAVVMYDSVTTI